jgi:hypothetical protein
LVIMPTVYSLLEEATQRISAFFKRFRRTESEA